MDGRASRVSTEDRRRAARSLVGLCAECAFSRRQESSKGSAFWRCGRSEEDSHFPRYPSLPVERCTGFVVRITGENEC